MKLGWLVWEYTEDEHPILLPDGHPKLDWCHRKVRIVYAEVTE